MEQINFIFRLGVVFAIYGFLWGILQLGYNIVRSGAKKSIFEEYSLKILKYFFLVDVVFIFGFDSQININQQIITALILLTYFISKLQNQQNRLAMFQMVTNGLPKKEEKFDIKAEIIVIVFAISFFIGFMLFPQYAQNPLSNWFHDSIIDIEDTPVFGFIFKVIGFIFIFNMFSKMLIGFSQLLSGTPFNKKTSINKETKENNKFDDFEEIE